MRSTVLRVALVAAVMLAGGSARAARLPTGSRLGPPTLDPSESGLNEGEGHRLTDAQLEALSGEPGVEIWRFHGSNWMKAGRTGTAETLDQVRGQLGGRPLGEVVKAYRFDMDSNGTPEILLTCAGDGPGGRLHYGATILTKRGEEWKLLFQSEDLPGETYQVEDIRDHDGDGRLEVIVTARAGSAGFYTTYGVLAFTADGTLKRYVTRPPDTLHLVDLDRNGHYELLVRHLVSRRGPGHLWTFVDRVVLWDGTAFVEEPPTLAAYHDEVGKPRLIDELIDHFDEDVVVLKIKTDILRQLQAHVEKLMPSPGNVEALLHKAQEQAKAGSREQAATTLLRALKRSPYEPDVLRLSVSVALQRGRFVDALRYLYALLGVVPDDMLAWRQMGLCFALLHERTAAVACFHNSVKLGEDEPVRMAALRKAAASERNQLVKAAKDAAIAVLEGKPLPEPPVDDLDVGP